jgi:hypothetical protein
MSFFGGQSQQRAEAAVEAVHLANTHKGRMNCFLEARLFGDLPLLL